MMASEAERYAYSVDEVLDEVAKYLIKQYGAPYGMTHPVDRQRVKDALAAREAK